MMAEKVLYEFLFNGREYRIEERPDSDIKRLRAWMPRKHKWQLVTLKYPLIEEILRLSAELTRANREIARVVNGDTTYFEWQHGLEPPREEEGMSTLDRKILAAASSARRAGRDDGLRAALEAARRVREQGFGSESVEDEIERLIEDDKEDDDE